MALAASFTWRYANSSWTFMGSSFRTRSCVGPRCASWTELTWLARGRAAARPAPRRDTRSGRPRRARGTRGSSAAGRCSQRPARHQRAAVAAGWRASGARLETGGRDSRASAGARPPRGTGQKPGSDGADGPGRVAEVERRPGATDHRVAHAGCGPVGDVVVEPYRVIGEPEHEVGRSASEHALAVARVAVGGAVFVRHPDDADEGAQRRSRGPRDRGRPSIAPSLDDPPHADHLATRLRRAAA